jgi:aryl-alcohol dehydrogenase-like predicted oxidoreductase
MNAAAAGTVHLGDLTVPRMGYGTMRLPGPGIWGPPADRDAAIRVLRRAVDLGVRAIDTAWYYGLDIANELVAAALRPYPDDLVLITKLGGARREDGSWYSSYTAEALRAGCERDLRVLGLDTIPVTHLRLSGRDEDAPLFDEALGTMLDLQREGKVQRIGLSNIALDQLETALKQTPIVSVSNPYSVFARRDDPMVEECTRRGIAYLPFFPLAAGAGQYERVAGVAASLGVTPTQVALAWLLARSPVMLPIPGTSSVAHLEENIAAAAVSLPAEALAALDAPAA